VDDAQEYREPTEEDLDAAAAAIAARRAAMTGTDAEGDGPKGEAIAQPGKLLRIAAMIRELLEETRSTTIDEKGRVRLRQIYERSLQELTDVLSEDLQRELAALAQPMEGVPSESEIRIAQAQLVGWLEGLFHGIQAALWAQQQQMRAQFEEMRRRSLPGGMIPQMAPPQGPGGGPDARGPGEEPTSPGQYL
jgi:hypothetical protein